MQEISLFLIVCPLVFIGGFVDSIAGGGGLISLPAYLITGLPVHNCLATNKLSSAMGTTIATISFWRQGFILLKLSLPCVAFAFLGSTGGAHLALLVDDHIFKILLVFILPLTAIYVFKSKSFGRQGGEPYSFGRTLAIGCLIALVIGLYDGFYGPGAGAFLLLLLTGAAHMDLHLAAGTTKAINLSTNVAALTTFLLNGQVLLPLGLTAGLFGIAGNYLGARCFIGNGVKIAKPLIGSVLILFFLKLIWELLAG